MAAAATFSSPAYCEKHLPKALFKAFGGDEGVSKKLPEDFSLTCTPLLPFVLLDVTAKDSTVTTTFTLRFAQGLVTKVSMKKMDKLDVLQGISRSEVDIKENERVAKTEAFVQFVIATLNSK